MDAQNESALPSGFATVMLLKLQTMMTGGEKHDSRIALITQRSVDKSTETYRLTKPLSPARLVAGSATAQECSGH